ncbi:hypothetical protein [Allorhizobium taibaishanense]|uniref:Uncharacterized protein n=1 Tax=Allorhizobium taibaishanense TaxID=887144 RepID=A0A7W6HLU7_9HYPH|nr:hypothetical protein [Allorhizobium taibaishanense]MBB4007615.1 hypothetical protein [Allorhizobium taibaishanense]
MPVTDSILFCPGSYVQKEGGPARSYPLEADLMEEAWDSAAAGRPTQKARARTVRLAMKTASDVNAAMSCKISFIAHSCSVMLLFCSPFV